jgi:predicted metalloprotease
MGGRAMVLGGGGIGTLIVILIIAFLGGDPRALLQQTQTGTPSGGGDVQLSPEEQELGEMVKAVLGDTEDVWNPLFRQMGREYQEPKLVLFTGQTQSACGVGTAQTGPFYCPADQKVYIDLSFYRDLRQRFKAPGDFAQAYVIAHEVGHHVQNLMGTSDMIHQARSRLSEAEYNQLSVRLELQADFYAGVWAHYSQKHRNTLEPGDIEEAIRAASAIGDDNIQKQAQGYVVPDSFTHGTGEQRVRWFTKGYKTGDIRQGDTFNAPDL